MTHLLSVQVGHPVERTSEIRDGQEAVWTSGIDKRPIQERVHLGLLGLDGDGQADLKNHGGKDKAVCCYAADHYDGWRETLGLSAATFPFGAFGENFTIVGLTEDAVCIGDIYTVGTARVQISQPRMPCYKLGRLWERPDLPNTVKDSGKTGYYLRVLEPGDVGPGDPLTLMERPLPQWTVARINDAMYVHKEDEALADELGRLSLLAEAWRSPFRRRAGLIRYRADAAQ
jgi:MOSC domain-containing protein YiiM